MAIIYPINKQLFLGLLLAFGISSVSFGQKLLKEAYPYKNQVNIQTTSGYQIAQLWKKKTVGIGKGEKQYYWYLPDSIRHTQGAYQGHLLYGPYRELYPDKSMKLLGAFKKGLQHGEWRYLDPNGTLRRISHWKRGEEDGEYRLYDEKGKLKEQGQLDKGLKNGIISRYTDQDSLAITRQRYKHGVMVEEVKNNWFNKLKEKL